MFVIEKLWKNEELLAQELISEIHSCIHNSWSVSSDGVGDMTNVNRIQMLVIRRSFHEDLR